MLETKGGKMTFKGYKHSEEAKARIGVASKGNKYRLGTKDSEETCKKRVDSRKGYVVSEKTRQNMSKAQMGKVFSDETRKKIGDAGRGRIASEEARINNSKSKMGRVVSDETRKKIGIANSGKTPSEEAREKMSKIRKGKLKGEKNPSWKGGVSLFIQDIRKSYEYARWRREVFARDYFTCCMCGKRGGSLASHHITLLSTSLALAFDINNGITLCKKCHGKIRWHEAEYAESFLDIVGGRVSQP
jgi:hypothetical protein